MTNRDQLTLTLRARCASDDLIPGALMASLKGRVVYRILEVTHVRRAGGQGYRVRIVCAGISRADVSDGAEVLPWPRDRWAPRGSRRAADRQRVSADPGPPEPPAARLRAKTPLLLALAAEPIRQAKRLTRNDLRTIV
jgi:hypothetical protein